MDLLEQIRKILHEEVKTIELNIEALRKENRESIEALRKESRQAHNEIMQQLTESNEVNGKEIKQLKKQVKQLDEDAKFPSH